LWQNKDTQEKLIKALTDNRGYELVITGHSLGAGAACLLTIMLYHDKEETPESYPLPPGVKIRCFAFAPPPVYLQKTKNRGVKTAIMNTAAFIHENDGVPFLSADSVRRLAKTSMDVDAHTKKLWYPQRKLMAVGLLEPTSAIVHAVEDGSRLPNLNTYGSERVGIPAPFVIWMRQLTTDDKNRPVYNASLCRPMSVESAGAGDAGMIGLSDLPIFLNRDMISDHMMPGYEQGLSSIRAQILHKQDGYLV
jgi:hypothetical protein